ncbi:hypothetical protein M3Y98_00674200 [Aphelenchoides besseyi]|nr:hypothetical protein M3Y98_00674200 [Aphelenchoides besseyi]KAI6209158.1 hypothetical protein M3Y96_00191600 [Aphelenchoides besseyi]
MRSGAFLVVVLMVSIKAEKIDFDVFGDVDYDLNLGEENRMNYHRLNSSVEKISPALRKFLQDPHNIESNEHVEELTLYWSKKLLTVQKQTEKVDGEATALTIQAGYPMAGNIMDWFCDHICSGIRLWMYGIISETTSPLWLQLNTYFSWPYRGREKEFNSMIEAEDRNDNGGAAMLTCPSGGRQTWDCGPETNKYMMFGAWIYGKIGSRCPLCPVQGCCNRHDACWDEISIPGWERQPEIDKCDEEFKKCISDGYNGDTACQFWFSTFANLVTWFGSLFSNESF